MNHRALASLIVQKKERFSTRDLWAHFKTKFALSLHTSEATLSTDILESDLHRPGLALAGYTGNYSPHHIQLLGNTEWHYLEAVGADKRRQIFTNLSQFRSPLWITTYGLVPHEELREMCEAQNIPLMCTALPTVDFARGVQRLLEEWFAPSSVVHASLVDVYGVGLLYVGQSSIGKSECVLDLVERGHRLVADDAVRLVRLGNSIVGRSNSVIKSHMEIRGLGIIDVRSMFGVKSVRRVKKIEMVVELRNWNQAESYERTGLDHLYDEIMGVQIPRVVIPVSPGKNITVISEVIAMNKLMKSEGVDSAKLLDEALRAEIERKTRGEASHELFQGEIWDFYE